ncbi:MAG TPA: hypothetical protein VH477_02375 [Bryobacteraceae bacterium]
MPPVILGGLARIFGSLERAFVAADCIFPPLLLLLFYSLAGVSDVRLRLLVAWSSLIIPFGLLNSFWLGDDALVAPLEITRTPQPELSFLILLSAAALLSFAIKKRVWWLWAIGAGVASAAVVYSYYFYAVAWDIALVCAVLLGLLWRRRLLWLSALTALVTTVVLSVPYALAARAGAGQGGQTDLLVRMGVFTHRPSIPALIVALLLSLAAWRFARHLPPVPFILSLLVLGALCGMNVQIVSGYETQPWHFWKRLALPVLFFLLAGCLARFVERRVVNVRAPAMALLIILIVSTAARLCVAGIRTAPYQRASSPDPSLLVWIRRNLAPDQVIGTTNPELILLIPALTSEYTYVPSGLRSLTSRPEIVDRYYEMACILGWPSAQLASAAAIPSHLDHSTEVLHTLGLSYTGDPTAYSQFVNGYQAKYALCSAPRYRLDFVVASSGQEAQAIRRRFPDAHELYHNEGYRLLDVRANRPSGRNY